LHRVTLRSILHFADWTLFGDPGPKVSAAGTYPVGMTNYRFAHGKSNDLLQGGFLFPGEFAYDLAGRTGGVDSTFTYSKPDQGALIVGASNATGAAALPTYGLGFFTSVIAAS
jgi:hypothetical protein